MQLCLCVALCYLCGKSTHYATWFILVGSTVHAQLSGSFHFVYSMCFFFDCRLCNAPFGIMFYILYFVFIVENLLWSLTLQQTEWTNHVYSTVGCYLYRFSNFTHTNNIRTTYIWTIAHMDLMSAIDRFRCKRYDSGLQQSFPNQMQISKILWGTQKNRLPEMWHT